MGVKDAKRWVRHSILNRREYLIEFHEALQNKVEMKEFLSTMLPHEAVLMVLGIALFLLLSYGIQVSIKNSRSAHVYLTGLIFPIIMIGFPAITHIKTKNVTIELAKNVGNLVEFKDTTLIDEIREDVDVLSRKTLRSGFQAETLVAGYIALDSLSAAEDLIKEASNSGIESDGLKEHKKWLKNYQKIKVPASGAPDKEIDASKPTIQLRPEVMDHLRETRVRNLRNTS